MKKFHIDKIDSVRGIAILLVLSYHTLLVLFPGYEAKEYDKNGLLILTGIKAIILNFNPAGQGWIGVELFLVISGFLIHLIHLKNGSKFNLKHFFNKRFWRIYPPYFVVLLFFFLVSRDRSMQGMKDVLSHIFLVHTLNSKTYFAINGSYWSIALECQLYLLYPVYLYLLSLLGNTKTVVLVFLFQLTSGLIAYLYNLNSIVFYGFVINYWIFWCMGAFLADRYYNDKKIFSKPGRWFLFLFLLFFLLKLFFITRYLISVPITFSCLAFIELVVYSNWINNSYVARRIIKLLSYIGVVSYSIYLVHQPLLANLINYCNPLTHLKYLNICFSVFFSWLVVLLISYALYHLLEIKSIRYGQQLKNNSTN